MPCNQEQEEACYGSSLPCVRLGYKVMGWLIFLGGAMFGGTVGIFTMCLLQVNHLNEADSDE